MCHVTDREANRLMQSYLDQRTPTHRFASWDFCFGYFQSFRRKKGFRNFAAHQHLHRSCLELGFYLASWGMFRGSADLLNKNFTFLAPLVKTLVSAPKAIITLDIDAYDDKGSSTWRLFEAEHRRIAEAMRGLKNGPGDVLITKIMMGVYGSVPAFDQYVRKALGTGSLGKKAVLRLMAFYQSHRHWLGRRRIRVLSPNGRELSIVYPKARIVDMILFMKGQELSAKK